MHLLGTAALERFTGYTAQSRSRHATHTWNVARLPESDHGGVLADQRSPEQEVLDALRRLLDTGFAVHDAPSHVERLLTERAALHVTLRHRPPDRRPAFRQAELALASAKKDLYWANYRLRTAEERLDGLGPLSQLRRHGRKARASLLDQVDRFTGEVQRAEAKITQCQHNLDEIRAEVSLRPKWDAEHGWPDTHLHRIDAELAEVSRRGQRIEGVGRDTAPRLSGRRSGVEHEWLHRLAEVARPPLPGRDLGIDLGP